MGSFPGGHEFARTRAVPLKLGDFYRKVFIAMGDTAADGNVLSVEFMRHGGTNVIR